MKRLLLVAMLAAILCPAVAEAGPLQRAKQRGGKVLAKGEAAAGFVVRASGKAVKFGGGALKGVCGRLGCG